MPPGVSLVISNLGGGFYNAGTKTGQRLVTWERFDNKILLKEKSFSAVADEELPISISVENNNYAPTLYAFDINAYNADSTAVVIDVTKFYKSDVKAISGLSSRLRKSYKVRSLDGSRSFITSMKAFHRTLR